jgi:hypothetical protein
MKLSWVSEGCDITFAVNAGNTFPKENLCVLLVLAKKKISVKNKL